MSNENSKKKCFVITPIGDNDSTIRRHIDGIIDQAIIPALESNYTIDVAHRKFEIGSINDRVIKSVYESDLVITNLTNLNPNVMFELAMRYSFGKPAIVIAEQGTKLPFDIIDENTIFYINDPAGANELKEKLIEFEGSIDLNKTDYGPVYKIINQIPLYKAVESGQGVSNEELLSYVISRLDSLENSINNNNISKVPASEKITVKYDVKKVKARELFEADLEKLLDRYEEEVAGMKNTATGVIIYLYRRHSIPKVEELLNELSKLLNAYGINEYVIY